MAKVRIDRNLVDLDELAKRGPLPSDYEVRRVSVEEIKMSGWGVFRDGEHICDMLGYPSCYETKRDAEAEMNWARGQNREFEKHWADYHGPGRQ